MSDPHRIALGLDDMTGLPLRTGYYWVDDGSLWPAMYDAASDSWECMCWDEGAWRTDYLLSCGLSIVCRLDPPGA